MSEAIFGIDLGTTNSVIARISDGRPTAVPIAGSVIVPSVVLFREDGVVVGREARNLELQHPAQTIRSVKRKMGQAHRYDVAGRSLSPEEVSAEILRTLKRGAEAETGTPVEDVVITVPAYFNDAQRRATLAAGELAGLRVLRLLNEPTSASLVYDQVVSALPEAAGPELVLIYDLGGGTFDVSVLEVFEGVREVRATCGNSALGGDDFDELILRHFLDELRRKEGVDPREDARAMARLRAAAEDAKIRLSQETQVRVREEFLTTAAGRPVHLDVELTRRQLEDLLRPLLASTLELSRRAVSDADLQGERIARVCLVGGSTRIPLVRQLLEAAFDDAQIHEEIDPDLAVGLGAAVQSAILKGAPIERILVDVTAHTLGIRAVGEDDEPGEEPDTFAPVLRRNTALPAERTDEFYTMYDGQRTILVEVFQGEAPHVSLNVPVGSFQFELQPRPAQSPVQVKFAYDLDGVVRVSASQPGTGLEKTVAFQVADAARGARPAQAPMTPVERKAEALLLRLEGAPRERLLALLAAYRQASGPPRERAEEALLDFFLDQEDRDDSDEEG